MFFDFHSRLSEADIEAINQHVKDNPPSAQMKQEIAAMTGRHIRTVERWFSHGQTGTRLISKSFEGLQPMRASLDVSDEARQRIFTGLLQTGGPSGELFTGQQREKTGTRATFGGLVDELTKVSQHYFSRVALHGFSYEQIEGGYQWAFLYARNVGDETPTAAYDLPYGDEIPDEDWPDDSIEEAYP